MTATETERYVFDTNVLISALLFEHSTPAQALFLALRRGTLLVSLDVLHELNVVLRRPKFDRYVTVEEREQFLSQLTLAASLIDITEGIQACRDPKDDKFLELAVNGQATYLVSGDPDLLILNPFRDIPIITPATVLTLLQPSNE